MRIAILNQPLGNRGDEAAHKALMRSLLKELPQHKFSVIFLNVQPDLIDTFKVQGIEYTNVTGFSKGVIKTIIVSYALKNRAIARIHPLLHKFKRILASYDAVICAPGGICMGGFTNWKHIWELDLAISLGKKVFYWGRSIGPFNEDTYLHRLFKKSSVRLLKSFTYVSLRDRASYQLASELGIASDEIVDSAFLETPKAEIPEDILKKINGDYVVFVPNSLTWHYRYKDIPHQCIIKGDGKYAPIAAASVLAKTHRDEYMKRIAAEYPQYGWDKNMAYPTAAHREAIKKYGITPYHRLSYTLLRDEPALF